MKNNIEYILKMVLNFLVIGVVIFLIAKLFIFLLPIILVLIIGYYLYRIFFQTKFKEENNKPKSNNKNLKNKIEEAEVINEKFDK